VGRLVSAPLTGVISYMKNLIRLDFVVQPPSPCGEGYNWVKFIEYFGFLPLKFFNPN
jgi:hypothetical protein